MPHPRENAFSDYTGNIRQFIIFKNDRRLRGHAVKHFADAQQVRDGWEELLALDKTAMNTIATIRKKLGHLGCPIIKAAAGSETCLKCKHYSTTSKCKRTGVVDLEELYCQAGRKIIESCLSTPRFVLYSSIGETQKKLRGIVKSGKKIKGAVVLHSYEHEFKGRNIYNVASTFVKRKEVGGQKRSFADWRLDQFNKIWRESNGNPDWQTRLTWDYRIPV